VTVTEDPAKPVARLEWQRTEGYGVAVGAAGSRPRGASARVGSESEGAEAGVEQ
jgi:hypothetical protein